MTDFRKDPRGPIELEVAYQRLNAFIVDYTRNVSHGGMFVASDDPLPRGTRLVFQLRIPGRAQPFEVLGEIVHTGGGDVGAGMGVRFVWEDEEARRVLAGEVERRVADSLGARTARELLRAR